MSDKKTTITGGVGPHVLGGVTIGRTEPAKTITIGPNRELHFAEDGTILVYGRPVGSDQEVFLAIRSWAMATSAFSLGGMPPPFVRRSHSPDWPMGLFRAEAGRHCILCDAYDSPKLRDGEPGKIRHVDMGDGEKGRGGRSFNMCVRCLVRLGAELERVRERAGQPEITPDDVYRITREWSAADRSRVMSALCWPTSRQGVVKTVDFGVLWLFKHNMVKLTLEEGEPAYIDQRNLKIVFLSLLPADDPRRQREDDLELDVSQDVAVDVLVGKHVTIDEHPTVEGVVHRVWVKDKAEDDHGH